MVNSNLVVVIGINTNYTIYNTIQNQQLVLNILVTELENSGLTMVNHWLTKVQLTALQPALNDFEERIRFKM